MKGKRQKSFVVAVATSWKSRRQVKRVATEAVGHRNQGGGCQIPIEHLPLFGCVQPELRIGEHAHEFVQRILMNDRSHSPSCDRACEFGHSAVVEDEAIQNDVGIEYE